MQKKITSFVICLAIFLTLHYTWTQWAADGIYSRALEPYATAGFSAVWFIFFGLLFTAGLVWLALFSGDKRAGMSKSLLRAGIYGLVIFGLSNIRNLQLFSDWQLGISIIDTVWGAVVATTSVALTIIILEKLNDKKIGARHRSD
jgi:uncharacterized membrane protein